MFQGTIAKGGRERGVVKNPQEKLRRSGYWIPWLLFLLAVAERLAFQIGSRDRGWPFSVFYEGDAEVFYNYAQAILLGMPFDGGIPFHPPLFPAILALLHGILGDPVPHGILRAILGVASAAVPAMLYLLVRRLVSRPVALIAGLLSVFSFGLGVIGTSATSEGIYLLILCGMLLIATVEAKSDRGRLLRAFGLGVLGGLLALTRAEGILLAIVIPIVWIVRERQSGAGRFAQLGVVALAGLVLILTPWTIRNAGSLTRWNAQIGSKLDTELPTLVPITMYGPLNFVLANNDLATGGFQRRLLSAQKDVPVLDLSVPQHRHHFLNGTSEGLRWITGNPSAFGRLVVKKLDISSRAFDLGWLPWNLPHGREGTRLPVDLFAPENSGLRWIQLGLALVGLILLIRTPGTRRAALILALPVVAALASTILFFGYVRLGMLAAPFIYAFEAVALAAGIALLPKGLRERFGRRGVGIVLAGAAVIVLIFAAQENRDHVASGTSDRPGGKLNRDAPITIAPASD